MCQDLSKILKIFIEWIISVRIELLFVKLKKIFWKLRNFFNEVSIRKRNDAMREIIIF